VSIRKACRTAANKGQGLASHQRPCWPRVWGTSKSSLVTVAGTIMESSSQLIMLLH
jgi:hypothetical protein